MEKDEDPLNSTAYDEGPRPGIVASRRAKKLIGGIVAAICVALSVSGDALSGWLVYHKPAFEGKIIDAQTKEPIEGALVAAFYYERYYTPVDSDEETVHVEETVTDKNGLFRFPPYTAAMSPLRTVGRVTFTIFKPGYASLDRSYLEGVLSGKPPRERHEEYPWWGKKDLIFRFDPGLVALPRLKNHDDRLRAINDIRLDPELESPRLKQVIDTERVNEETDGLYPILAKLTEQYNERYSYYERNNITIYPDDFESLKKRLFEMEERYGYYERLRAKRENRLPRWVPVRRLGTTPKLQGTGEVRREGGSLGIVVPKK